MFRNSDAALVPAVSGTMTVASSAALAGVDWLTFLAVVGAVLIGYFARRAHESEAARASHDTTTRRVLMPIMVAPAVAIGAGALLHDMDLSVMQQIGGGIVAGWAGVTILNLLARAIEQRVRRWTKDDER